MQTSDTYIWIKIFPNNSEIDFSTIPDISKVIWWLEYLMPIYKSGESYVLKWMNDCYSDIQLNEHFRKICEFA